MQRLANVRVLGELWGVPGFPGRQPLSREGGRLRLVGSAGNSIPGRDQHWQSPEVWQSGTSIGGKCPVGQECAEWGGPR